MAGVACILAPLPGLVVRLPARALKCLLRIDGFGTSTLAFPLASILAFLTASAHFADS